MKKITPDYLDLPIGILLTGIITPVMLMLFLQDTVNALPYYEWCANFMYVAFTLAATEFVVRALFVRPNTKEHIDIKHLHLQIIVRSCMMGIVLIIIDWNAGLKDFDQAFRYMSLRLGITLLLLGALVMFITHRKMKAL